MIGDAPHSKCSITSSCSCSWLCQCLTPQPPEVTLLLGSLPPLSHGPKSIPSFLGPGWLQVSMRIEPLSLLALFHRVARRLLISRGASACTRAPSSLVSVRFREGDDGLGRQPPATIPGTDLGGSEAHTELSRRTHGAGDFPGAREKRSSIPLAVSGVWRSKGTRPSRQDAMPDPRAVHSPPKDASCSRI